MFLNLMVARSLPIVKINLLADRMPEQWDTLLGAVSRKSASNELKSSNPSVSNVMDIEAENTVGGYKTCGTHEMHASDAFVAMMAEERETGTA